MIVLYVLLALCVLLFMVLIHELGHYVVGRILKFKITEFSVGFGKALFQRTNKRGEKISLRIFPLGGYCAFYGEDSDENDPQAFNNQKPWKRILVFLAGVTFNFITAIIFSWILLCCVGYDVRQVGTISPVPKYNAEVVLDDDGQTLLDDNGRVVFSSYYDVSDTLKSDDVILKINGKKVDFAFGYNFSTLIAEVQKEAESFYSERGLTAGQDYFGEFYSATFTVKRAGKVQDILVIFYPSESVNSSGERATTYVAGFTHRLYKYGFFEGLGRSFSVAFGFAWVVLKSLCQLITFSLPISDIGGPITTITTMAQVTQSNMLNLLVLIPLLSANLAIFNVLPFPALDGAHVVFTVIEWIRKKPIKREVEAKIHFVGLCVLLGFVVIVDILHFLL